MNDFLFRPTGKQMASLWGVVVALLAILWLLTRGASAIAAPPPAFKWEGSPPNTKVALVADLGSCQVYRIRVFTNQYYKEVFVIQNNGTTQRPACGIAS